MTLRDALRGFDPVRPIGRVARIIGNEVEVRGLRLRVGDGLMLHGHEGAVMAQVVAVDGDGAICLLLGPRGGLGKSDPVTIDHRAADAVVGPDLLGRVLDGFGNPMDGLGHLGGTRVGLEGSTPAPLQRGRIDRVLDVGVRVLDTFCTIGAGQRLGIYGGSGVGKSTLLGMMARGTTADVNVVALIGERGREVREFLEDDLRDEGRARTVAVVATSDQPALVRLRAAHLANRIAQWFADQGNDVLLMVDSLTRIAMAQREVGLAAGEPPTSRGYTPSVFSLLPDFLEQAGPRVQGTVTGLYTVLVEGDDLNDPIGDATRGILDGHIVLDRRLAIEGRYPSVDPLASLSRLAAKLISPEQAAIATGARSAMAAAAEVRELVEVGAYVAGTNPRADRGLQAMPELIEFLRQPALEPSESGAAWAQLAAISNRMGLA